MTMTLAEKVNEDFYDRAGTEAGAYTTPTLPPPPPPPAPALRNGREVQTRLTIGNLIVDIQTHVSCSHRWWYGTFPDDKHCCVERDHSTRAEAVLCSRLRVALGYTHGLPPTSIF